MNYILETERLRLRQFERSDATFIFELVNTPGWLTFIGDRKVKTIEDAVGYLQNGPMKSYRENGFGLSMVELKNEQTAIGMCGILKRDSLEHPEIGFALLPAFIGKGYAVEIAQATLNYAVDKLNLKTINAIVVPANERSIHVLKKIEFKFVKTIVGSYDNVELMLFSS